MATRQLMLQTFNLIIGFMVWVILSALMPFIKQDIHLSAGEITFVTAIPVILGSLFRIPIGYWTNRFGARIVFTLSFVVLIVPVYLISIAHSVAMLIIGGFFLGISGAVFSVGVTSLPKYYSKEKHGLVNGIYGMGNMGNAFTTFFGPVVATQFGWAATTRMFIVLLAICVAATFFLGDRHEPQVRASIVSQFKDVYKNDKLWLFSLFYFITFGSYVAFTVYLPNFMVVQFGLTKIDAGLRVAGFIVVATSLRPLGGWMADRWNAYKVLMFVFTGLTIAGIILSFRPTLPSFTVGCLSVALCAGIGNGVVFKIVPLHFPKQAGFANGLVAAFGGLGGFFPPLMLTAFHNATGNYAIGFMLLSECALGSFVIAILLFYQARLQLSSTIINKTVEGIMITDVNGVIQSVNPAFTTVTGYTRQEVVNRTPAVLQSGKQNQDFYENMWGHVKSAGHWEGQIWNKRKNGDIYLEWLTITAIEDDAGEVQHYVGMFSDITPRSSMNDTEPMTTGPAR